MNRGLWALISGGMIAHAPEDGGTGGGDTGTGDAGAGEENAFASSLTGEGYSDFAKEQGWKSADDAVKAYQDQRSGLEGMIKVPGKDASDEDRAAFAKALGVPDTADGYQFSLPEKMPENVQYDEKLATSFKAKAKEIGLTPMQAQALHDFQMEAVGSQASSMMEGQKQAEAEKTAKAEASHDALVKAWGKEGSESYTKNLALANRALNKMVPDGKLMEEFKSNGVFAEDGAVLMPHFAQALAAIGQTLYSEDGDLNGDILTDENPWDANTFNLTKQGEIYKANPEKAERLKAAAKAKRK
nr:hypothetical protein [uncultured Cohaesibacter sp.]